jgi:Zn-dependent M28 family amino/carboxypeptidase
MILSMIAAGLALSPADVDARRLMGTVRHLSTAWPDRNTNNPTCREAADWVAAEFRKIPGMQVELMPFRVEQGPRIRETKEVVQVVATLPGRSASRILMGGHLDTIALPLPGWSTPSPGANDDASGVAATLECARLLARGKWENTLVFVAFTGEEQGLLGARALAARAKAEKWEIAGVLNNDTVGSSESISGRKNKREIRIFSADDMPEGSSGSARELARWIESETRSKVRGFGVKLVFRNDRFGRGGDHTPFQQAGFPAVRFTEAVEEYSRQHTSEDLAKYVDARYLANVTRVNLLALQSLAQAGPSPTRVRIDRAQGEDTRLTWTAKKGVRYRVYWRETLSPVWQGFRDVGEVGEAILEKIHKDDHEFGVAAVGGVPVPAL